MKACVRRKIGETGETFDGAEKLIGRQRNKITFLENLEALKTVYEWDGKVTSDLDYIREVFEGKGMTMLHCSMDSLIHGAPHSLHRLWMIIFDIPAWKSKALNVEAKFLEILNSLKLDPSKPEDFFLTEDQINSVLSPGVRFSVSKTKKAKEDEKWKLVHEQCCSENNLTWPPTIEHVPLKLRRQSEVVVICNELFPATLVGVWEWIDTNHTLERTLKLMSSSSSVRRPWHAMPPTFTGYSSIVGRQLTEDGTVIFKHIHPIEGFNMKGWDLSQWSRPVGSQDARVTLDVLNGIVGNMWSMYHFLPLFIAAAGCVNWDEVESLQPDSPKGTDIDSISVGSDSD